MAQISDNNEKLDAYIAFASAFGSDADGQRKGEFLIVENFQRLTALDDKTRQSLVQKAEAINRLPVNSRKMWLASWRERLRRRGATVRLDANVHAEQVASVLEDEPTSVRMIIESNLPDEMAQRVAIILQSSSLFSFVRSRTSSAGNPEIDSRLVKIVRERFLSNFVAHEDILDSSNIDRFSTKELGNFIWHLGLREIACACRGIKSIEKLAGFLKSFEEDTAREIGRLIADLEDVGIDRVEDAEYRVKEAVQTDHDSDDLVRRVGMSVFAEVLSCRADEAVRFSLQKLPVNIANELQKRVEVCRSGELRSPKCSVTKEARVLAAETAATGGV